MPRPRNQALRDSIADAACSLFHECGYARASYTLIATRCGITRALVQYHWPRKEALAGEAMRRILATVETDAGEHDDGGPGDRPGIGDRPNLGEGRPAGEAVAVACGFYRALLSDSGWRRFLLDVLADRELAHRVLPVGVDWMASRMGLDVRTMDADALDAAVCAMGGFHELLYRRLREGRYLDVEPFLRRVADELTR